MTKTKRRFAPPEEPCKLYTDGFSDDFLGRKKVGERLSEIVENIEDPLVIALDGRWGTGKSWFLQRWVGAHKIQNDGQGETIYFDAFAHDYLSDPLIALVAALAERLPDEEKKVGQLKECAVKLAKPLARVVLSAATFGATEALNDLGDAVAEAAGAEAKGAIDKLWEREEGRRKAMTEFRAAIRALTETGDQHGEARPLIIVIDELDRCRPDYALEILEIIKHFFAEPNVHFVLGVNMEALQNSVKARYGAEIDALAYLQKFVSFTMHLPDVVGNRGQTPSIIKYAEVTGSKMKIDEQLLGEVCSQLQSFNRENQISIRDVGKILSTVSVLPRESYNYNYKYTCRFILITLIIVRVIRVEVFQSLRESSIDVEAFANLIGATSKRIEPKLSNGDRNRDYCHDIAFLLNVWQCIIGNNVNIEDECNQVLKKLFDWGGQPQFFDDDDIRNTPKLVYENWMSSVEL